jgi:hypothetical protein
MARQFVGVRLPTDLVEKAKIAAESEHRTISNYILTLIAQDIERREALVRTLQETQGGRSLQQSPVKYPAKSQGKRAQKAS